MQDTTILSTSTETSTNGTATDSTTSLITFSHSRVGSARRLETGTYGRLIANASVKPAWLFLLFISNQRNVFSGLCYWGVEPGRSVPVMHCQRRPDVDRTMLEWVIFFPSHPVHHFDEPEPVSSTMTASAS